MSFKRTKADSVHGGEGRPEETMLNGDVRGEACRCSGGVAKWS